MVVADGDERRLEGTWLTDGVEHVERGDTRVGLGTGVAGQRQQPCRGTFANDDESSGRRVSARLIGRRQIGEERIDRFAR